MVSSLASFCNNKAGKEFVKPVLYFLLNQSGIGIFHFVHAVAQSINAGYGVQHLLHKLG
jgi:hypothetical protein